jgi:UDP-glucose 4-epimerase
MRVLVTGGSGFIGSHVVDKLRLRGHEPVIYDLRPSPWHGPEQETVLGSITDREALERALNDCDAVAHLAAVADVNDVHAEPYDAERVNARGTVTVLEAARRAGVRRIVYASTIWVYSDCAEDEVNEDTLLPPPSHLYTSTKLAGELYCKSYQELYGIDYTILRFGIPYGPRAREAAVIPAFVNKAFKGEPLTLAGDGLQSRKFVYVEDLADGVALGLADVASNRVYNLASDETTTIKQIAENVQRLIGNTEIVYTPARPGDFGGKTVNSQRAERELGWTAATHFDEGVKRYIDWRIEQREKAAVAAAVPPIPIEEPDAEARPRHVLIISADIGEGHDLPARAVAREFADEDPDAQISIINGLPAMGPILTKTLRENSAWMFRWVPWLFDIQYTLFMKVAPTRWLSKRLLTAFGWRGLRRTIRAFDPDVIVSTYPGVTAVLGEMRRKGRLEVPCFSSITDLAGLGFWSHPGIDLHFVTHPESIEEVEKIAGPGSVRWAKPPTSPAFLAPRTKEEGRKALGLPNDGKLIVVSGGGWGVGDLAGAVQAALSTEPDATVLCLCGRNDELRARLTQEFPNEPRLRLMGFTDRMGDVLAAGDVLIHSSAGLTVLEAIIRGTPVISYGFGYGHVRASNAALLKYGLAQVAPKETDLGPAIKQALAMEAQPDGRFAERPSTAQLILGDERRIEPLPAWRVRTARAATAVAAGGALSLWALTAGVSYNLVSDFAHIKPVTAVTTAAPQVGVLVEAPNTRLSTLADELSQSGLHATVTVDRIPSATELTALRTVSDQAVPRLPTGGLVRWMGERGVLRRLIRAMGMGHHHFLYASRGPSLGQWLVAHGAGGRLVAGAVKVDDARDSLGRLHPGEVVELDVSRTGDLRAIVDVLEADLQRAHLQSVPVGKLMRDAGQSA